jgi:hypothetical protein
LRSRDHLERVAGRLGDAVRAFFAGKRNGERFHLDDLEAFVGERMGGAPGSASRVMRALRARGVVAYRLVRRCESLYEVERGAVEVEPAQRELLT